MDLFKLRKKIEEEFQSTPPTIAVIGVSGVGKSSTLNSMFRTKLEVSATMRCTTEFSDHLVGATINTGPKKGTKVALRVIDAPGLGEDIKQDGKYLDMYYDNLPKCDVILWILSARNRAVALDQQYLLRLKDFHDRMIFGINQIDLVEPLNWDHDRNMPSKAQQKNIAEIITDRKDRLEDALGKKIQITDYTAKQYYRLIDLFNMMMDAVPKDRSWLFQLVKGFSREDWLNKVQGLTEEEKKKLLKKR